MPSGKQLSFQYGEVSPALQYKVDGPFYSAGLKKLTNGYIRKAGGVSNRPGFLHVMQSNFQDNLYLGKGASPQVKLYSVEGSGDNEGTRWIIEQAPEISGTAPSNRLRQMRITQLLDDQINVRTISTTSGSGPLSAIRTEEDGYKFAGTTNLKGGRLVQYGGDVYITFGNSKLIMLTLNTESYGDWLFLAGMKPTPLVTTGSPTAGTLTSTGLAPDLPVAYLITQELIDGTETPWLSTSLATGHPHSQRHVYADVSVAKSSKVKQYNVYRSDGGLNSSGTVMTFADISVGKGGHFSLVARMPAGYDNTSDTPTLETVRFTDYLTNGLFSEQPPLDRRLYGTNYTNTSTAWLTTTGYVIGDLRTEGGIGYICLVNHTSGVFATDLGNSYWEVSEDAYVPSTIETSRQRKLSNCRLIGHYQQRRIIIPASSDPVIATTGFDEGTIIASKLGTPDMLDAPQTLNDTDAFEFSLPVGKRNVIVGMLDRLPRLMVFTEKDAILIQGGDQGILTPRTVNPQAVGEGCSKYITPVSAGTRGYYINARHSKLIGVDFEGSGGEVAFKTTDLSILADHFLEGKDVAGLEVIEGVEDIVYVLLGDGTMVNITVAAGLQVSGWGKVEVAGDAFIESITKLRRREDLTSGELETNINPTPTKELDGDALYASIIRDGVRNLEVLMTRNDKFEDRDRFFYADAARTFGKRDLEVAEDSSYENALLNLTTGTTWSAGETITITELGSAIDWHYANEVRSEYAVGTGWINGAMFATAQLDFKIFFEYEVAGVLTVATFTPVTFSSGTVVTGTFDIDVPAHLQDATTLAATTMLTDQSRYRIGFNKVSGLTHLADKDVVVHADGATRANPNNTIKYGTVMTVDSSGDLTFPADTYYTHGVIGLPYTFEMQTLDLDTKDERTFSDDNKLINAAGIALHESRGVLVGQTAEGGSLDSMNEVINRESETFEEQTPNLNGHYALPITGGWEPSGSITIKQVDPEPVTVLAVYPKGMVSE